MFFLLPLLIPFAAVLVVESELINYSSLRESPQKKYIYKDSFILVVKFVSICMVLATFTPVLSCILC